MRGYFYFHIKLTLDNMCAWKLTKTFCDKLAKLGLPRPQEIDNLEDVDTEMFDLDNSLKFNGFIKNDKVLILIANSSKIEESPEFNISTINESGILDDDFLLGFEQVYFIVSKTKELPLIFSIDYTSSDPTLIHQAAFPLVNFVPIITNQEIDIHSISGLNADVIDAINGLRDSLGKGSDQRIPFIICSWILITNDNIIFKERKNGDRLNLKQWIQIYKAHQNVKDPKLKQSFEYIADQEMIDSTSGEDIMKAFENVIYYKITKHNYNKHAHIKDIQQMQLNKLKSTIESLYNDKTMRNAKTLIIYLYDEVYLKYGSDIEITKLAFDLEQNWNNRTALTTVSDKGQIYTHWVMKHIGTTVLGKNFRNGMSAADLCCGTGGFTETIYKYCLKHNLLNTIAYGNEIDEDCANMAWTTALCSSADAQIFQGDIFDPDLLEVIPPHSVDQTWMNAPFSMGKSKDGKPAYKYPEGFEWKENINPKGNPEPTEWTFYRYALDKFSKIGGWFLFVIPIQRVGTNSKYIADKTAFGFARGYLERKGLNPDDFPKPKIAYLASGCVGVKRTTGQHPGGIVVVPRDNDVYDFTPVQYPADDKEATWRTTHFDFESIHDTLLKLDLLGHVDPVALRMMCNLININIKDIPLNDPEVLSIFSSPDALKMDHDYSNAKTGALAIPEFGTEFVRGMLEETKPKTFADLVIISGLSHGTNVWNGNADELVREGKSLREVIGCRDDIMTYLIDKGLPKDISFTIMEKVRKGKGVQEEYEQLMRANKVPDYYIDSCKKIKYMFPKGHAVAYVTMAIRVGYFKVHYPLVFYATFFSVRSKQYDIEPMIKGKQAIIERIEELKAKSMRGAKEKISNKEAEQLKTLYIALEMVQRGYKFSNINIDKSDAENFVVDEENKALIPPFTTIDQLGKSAADSVIEARKQGPFTSKEDLLKRTKLSKTNVEELAKLHVLDGLDETDQLSLFDF